MLSPTQPTLARACPWGGLTEPEVLQAGAVVKGTTTPTPPTFETLPFPPFLHSPNLNLSIEAAAFSKVRTLLAPVFELR